MTALDFSADMGLLAVFLRTTNICLGQLIAVRYSPLRLWPHRRINILRGAQLDRLPVNHVSLNSIH